MTRPIRPDDLVIHFLNVGFGDTSIIEFPADASGKRTYGVVDCYKSEKTLDYLGKLMPAPQRLAFICATHPHLDHIRGISKIIRSDYCPEVFWDSGFRHNSQTYRMILQDILDKNVQMVRVSSGMESYYNQVRVTVLAPSVALRNRYNTYGVDMNNASIVLRIEHCKENTIAMQSREYMGDRSQEAERDAGRSVAILAGDAEFDSWSHVCQEYPKVERTSSHDPLVKKMVNYLSAAVIKVAHHGSMHSTPLDVYEKMKPSVAIISTEQKQSTLSLDHTSFPEITRDLFPHDSAVIALEESDTKVLTTDGSYEGQAHGGSVKDADNDHPGSIVVVIPPGGNVLVKKLDDDVKDMATPPPEI